MGVMESVDHERMAVDWGYCEINGPHSWVSKFPDAAGERQSPIDISPVSVTKFHTEERLQWKYEPESSTKLENTGAAWKVGVKGKGSELKGGPLDDEYVLDQFHCHWGETNDKGSEHTIDGEPFAGELHMVHWNSAKYADINEAASNPDGLSVLGVFLKPGKKNDELEKVVKYLDQITHKGDVVEIPESIDPKLLIPKDTGGYYTYHGSLTTPPCSECVIWVVFKEPIEVSDEQLNAFRQIRKYNKNDEICCDANCDGYVKKNFRPTVPIGEREVKECRQ
uniref:Carbonic anhydrase n=1 Tax=Diabrotica virgifera virgifera TaxID=50390 RepID=A0A6P7F8M6_DIAVI